MAIFSIDYANKLVKRLQDQHNSMIQYDRSANSYSYYVSETPEIPEYSFRDTQDKFEAIENMIIDIKHKIREVNMSKNIQSGITADEAILKLAFLTRKRDRVQHMANQLPRRQIVTGGSNGSQVVVCNYDVAEAKDEYNKICKEILQLQDELNTFNALNQIRIEEDIDMFFEV